MIISRTPFRVSFFGGGTDYPEWYMNEGGAVLSTTIDKYLYITVRQLPPFFEQRHRIVWSKVETPNDFDEIEHPCLREGLKHFGFDEKVGIDLHYQADLPARSGMGSSSAFAVGMINALTAFKGNHISKQNLALEAINLEQNVLNEAVGSQDQTATAYGGLNKIEFLSTGEIRVNPILISPQRISELSQNLMLFYTGHSRFSFEIAEKVINRMSQNKIRLKHMHAMVDQGINILSGTGSLDPFGDLLHETWQSKRSLSKEVSSTHIDQAYEEARKCGALGGKLLGAGGTGFMLFYVPPEKQPAVKKALKDLLLVPFSLPSQGSTIIYYDPVLATGTHTAVA